MEGGLNYCAPAPEMYQRPSALSFIGRRSYVPRPLTQVTEIYDTDFEDDDGEEGESPSDLDSASTLSSLNELSTPRFTNDLTGYQFQFDGKPMRRSSDAHVTQAERQDEDEGHEVLLALSPVPHTPRPEDLGKMSLNMILSGPDEFTVRAWTPEQVADYMAREGFDSVVIDKLLDHDIGGNVLLDLQFQDLKELDITSFGKRHQLMKSIQQLRNSTSVPLPLLREPFQVSRSESHRRGRQNQASAEDVVPAESVSIVAIEQVLPKLHQCSKGEDCPKWQRQQLKLARLEDQLAADMKALPTPSVVASSDILGPSTGLAITSERLSSVEPRDPLENVRNFLSFQHVNSPTTAAPRQGLIQPHFTQNLNGLPKLQIPSVNRNSEGEWNSPISALYNPTEQQIKLRADLQQDPYHYGGIASPVDVYRVDTPMTTTDIPITAIPIDPCQRETSHSVPPEMRYGNPAKAAGESITRSQSTQPSSRHRRQPSFVPMMTVLHEGLTSPTGPPVVSEADLVDHKGWMRKRKTTRLMKQEWNDNYCSLSGTQLGVRKDELSRSHESINVDEYTLHAYTTASSSKLSAAFKKSLRSTSPTKPSFAFSLIPEDQKKGLFEKDKSHHFAVTSGTDRVEWMRKLMLAKAMKKNNGQI